MGEDWMWRGRQGRVVGENGDNFNWTTIKKWYCWKQKNIKYKRGDLLAYNIYKENSVYMSTNTQLYSLEPFWKYIFSLHLKQQCGACGQVGVIRGINDNRKIQYNCVYLLDSKKCNVLQMFLRNNSGRLQRRILLLD